MFTVSRLATSSLAKSTLLVLLTATLTNAAYAGGGHGGSNGSTGPGAPAHGSAVQSDARIVSGNGSPPLSKGTVAHPQPTRHVTVRDHRGDSWTGIPNNVNIGPNGGGEGGLHGTQPAPPQPNRVGDVRDHRN